MLLSHTVKIHWLMVPTIFTFQKQRTEKLFENQDPDIASPPRKARELTQTHPADSHMTDVEGAGED